jgi:hypothetical protein
MERIQAPWRREAIPGTATLLDRTPVKESPCSDREVTDGQPCGTQVTARAAQYNRAPLSRPEAVIYGHNVSGLTPPSGRRGMVHAHGSGRGCGLSSPESDSVQPG